MKTLIVALTLMTISSAFAGRIQRHNYKCIISTLEAYNSDMYDTLSAGDIDEILSSADGRRWKVEEVTASCDRTDRVPNPKLDYVCIASALQAYNGSIYNELSPADIDALLNSQDGRSWKVREVAETCSSH